MLENQFIFIVGAPRSGTTWLKALLEKHPSVVSHHSELTVFSSYITHFDYMWNIEANPGNNKDMAIGLPSIWSEKEKENFIYEFIDKVYSKIPDSEEKVILDKHPDYIFHLNTIIKYLPHARIIHIIRDGRNMSMSMVNVNKREGFGWSDYEESALQWKKHVLAGKAFGKAYSDNYTEVKYEELLEDTENKLKYLLDALNIPANSDVIKEIAENASFKSAKLSSPSKEVSEKDRDKQEMWRKLSVDKKYRLQQAAGDLLLQLNYVNSEDWWYDKKSQKIIHTLTLNGKNVLKRIRNSIRALFTHPSS